MSRTFAVTERTKEQLERLIGTVPAPGAPMVADPVRVAGYGISGIVTAQDQYIGGPAVKWFKFISLWDGTSEPPADAGGTGHPYQQQVWIGGPGYFYGSTPTYPGLIVGGQPVPNPDYPGANVYLADVWANAIRLAYLHPASSAGGQFAAITTNAGAGANITEVRVGGVFNDQVGGSGTVTATPLTVYARGSSPSDQGISSSGWVDSGAGYSVFGQAGGTATFNGMVFEGGILISGPGSHGVSLQAGGASATPVGGTPGTGVPDDMLYIDGSGNLNATTVIDGGTW
jgi:hypothetical protein